MLIEAASRLNIQVNVLDTSPSAPAKQIANHSSHLEGSFTDADLVQQLASRCDVLTVEIEHVNTDALAQIVNEQPSTKVLPSPNVIRLIQDKYNQHVHLASNKVEVADHLAIEGSTKEALTQSLHQARQLLGLPFMLKSRTLAYDGRGNYLLKTLKDIDQALSTLGNGTRPLYAERLANFEREVAVMVVRGREGKVRSYPAVETVHKDNICHIVTVPLLSATVGLNKKVQDLAERAIQALGAGAVGVFGVEMFLMPDGTFYLLHFQLFGALANILTYRVITRQ